MIQTKPKLKMQRPQTNKKFKTSLHERKNQPRAPDLPLSNSLAINLCPIIEIFTNKTIQKYDKNSTQR